MNKEEDHIELFEKYFFDLMSTSEKESFENRLSADNLFNDGYEHYLDTISALKTYHFKKDVSEIHNEFISKSLHSKSSWRYMSGIAASIAIILVSAYLLFSNKSSNLELFEYYFEPYPNLTKIRGEEGLLSKAMESYSDDNYLSAITHFNKLIQNSGETDRINIYLGVSYMGNKDFEKAIQVLEKISSTGIYSEQAKWYLSLSHLAMLENKKAIKLLKSIGSTQYKYDEADELLNSF